MNRATLSWETKNLSKHNVQLRVFENKLTLYVGAETPPGLSEFLKDLEKEKKALSPGSEQAKLYDELKTQIDKRWFAAIAYKFMTEGTRECRDH